MDYEHQTAKPKFTRQQHEKLRTTTIAPWRNLLKKVNIFPWLNVFTHFQVSISSWKLNDDLTKFAFICKYFWRNPLFNKFYVESPVEKQLN